jgi:hypothetical protein
MKSLTGVLICLALGLSACSVEESSVYYVRMDGNDANNGSGNNPSGAWKTMTFAISQLKAGDELLVEAGIYSQDSLWIEDLHGTPDKPIRIASIQPWGALLTQPSQPEDNSPVLAISGSSYLEIDGFEVVDSVDTGIGITVRNGSHHIVIRNCYVHDCGCNGISSRLSDYVVIEDNVVRGNATRNEWNCSGISIWHPVELDKEPGYHLIIRGNVAFENECDLPFRPLGFENPTDGNGIIVDDFRNTQGGGQEGGYTSAVLVENNLSFRNGGRGFNVYKADNVTLRNNTSYHNLQIISRYADFPGDMTLSNSVGCRLYNNLIVKDPKLPTKALRSYDNDGLNTKIHHNLVIGPEDFCGQEIFSEKNVFLEVKEQRNAGFKQPGSDIRFTSAADFREYFGLLSHSRAIDLGSPEDAPVKDRDGLPRPSGDGFDAGCYEHQGDEE